MSYKILYIEDLDPSSIVSEFASCGIEAIPFAPTSFEATILEMVKPEYDAIVLDFRLTKGIQSAVFDAPTLAQTIRTKTTVNHKFSPIFLISNETVISTYYKDFTSHDLFDYSNSKEWFLQNVKNFCNKLINFIDAYKIISSSEYSLQKILAASQIEFQFVDFRIIESLKSDFYNKDTFAVSSYIYNNIIKSINFLVGEDVLSARLGIKKSSPDWNLLLTILSDFKYKGIFANSHSRWWFHEIEDWWKNNSKLNVSLRRLNSEKRCNEIKHITGLNGLIPLEKIKYSQSDNFWNICKAKKVAIDPAEGLELFQKDLLPWQDKEYISMIAGLESVKLYKYVKPADKKRLSEFEKTI